MTSNNYGFLLSELIKKGIRLKYRRSYLGILWSLIEPIFTTIILVIVFGTLFHTSEKTYPLYIIIGRLCFNFFSEGTKSASRAIRANASMVKKVYVPKLLYPLSNVLYTFIIFLISLVVLIGVDIYCRVVPTLSLLMFLPSLLLLLVFTFSVGLILCTLNVFFRDIEYLWNVILMMIMYVSAIFYYPEKILQSHFFWVLEFNPLYQIIYMARCCFLGTQFNWAGIVYTLIFTLVSLLFSLLFYRSQKDKFILHL